MSRRVGSSGRPTAVLVAVFGFAGLSLAASGSAVKPIERGARIAKPSVQTDDAAPPASGGGSRAVSPIGVSGPANDTCAGAVALTLNRRTKGSTIGANDDYHTPMTDECYKGDQFPTEATGRDVVFSFTAPSDGSYSFKSLQLDPTQPMTIQDTVLYLTDCAKEGTVTCLAGANHTISSAFTSSLGGNSNRGDMIACYQMSAGQTVYLVYDDGIPGRCDDTNHQCFSDAGCNDGAICNPQINNGVEFGVEVKPCNAEAEPNDTPAEANPYVCNMVGASSAAPVAHCYLGPRAGNVCTRSTFLEQTLPNADMRCSLSGARCSVDLATGIGTCGAGEGLCQSQVDLDCDPRCDVGPMAGLSCTTQAFCNPVSDQGATCGGSCFVESTCIDTATGADTGVACTPVCVGGLFPGRYCSALSGCPGGGVCTTTPIVGSPGATCGNGEVCGRQYNEGDTDYYSLGAPVAGSKVFAGVDGLPANDYDWRMRITSASNTLQMDDDDVTSWYGSNAPTIAGAITDGTPTFIQISRTTPRASANYELYAIVRPPLAASQLEDESGPTGNDIYFGWPGDVINANPINNGVNNGYVRGTFAFQGDSDCFKFLVNEGDLMDWYGDANPTRATVPVSGVDIPQPIIYDAEPAGISNFIFGANARKNTAANVQGPGLRALSPAVTSSYFQWRASYTGMLEICYYGASAPLSQGTPNHPNSWAGSMSVNCGPVQAAGPGTTTTDVSVSKTGPAGPVTTGDFITYTITVTNNGNEIAQSIDLQDALDPNLTFLSLELDDGFGGGNTACFSLPTAGYNDAPIDCINTSMAPGSSTVYTIHAQVNNCIGDGVTISNTASIVTDSTDPDNSNDSATHTLTTVAAANNGCTPLACSLDSSNNNVCVVDLCSVNNQCDAGGVCVSDPQDCDDNSLCTDDSCDPAVGCINDSTNAGDLCDDFNPCTSNTCDPLLFCVYPPVPSGVSCDDALACTVSDACDGGGTCVGSSVCDDDDPCTDDFGDEANACACSHAPAAQGTSCDDADVCTGTGGGQDACDGAGSCLGGQAVDCDDGDACTTDSCDSALGCTHTAITCDDGDVCNGAETCDPASGCVAGTALLCNDGNACNGLETCDAVTGCASGTPLQCDDGDVCNGGETCDVATGCVPGTPLACDDGNACNGVETCNGGTGCVNGTSLACDDGNACNGVETCEPANGCVAGTALLCNDGNACNGVETCDVATGCVSGTSLVCDDGNACNGVESCAPATGCVAGTAVICTASDTCHDVGACNPATGTCSNPPTANGAACDDADACTTGTTCNGAGTCVGGTAVSCPDDGDVCTANVCDPAIGCVASPTNLDTGGFSGSRVDGRDLVVLADAWNSCASDLNYDAAANLDQVGCVDLDDFHLFMNAFGQSCP